MSMFTPVLGKTGSVLPVMSRWGSGLAGHQRIQAVTTSIMFDMLFKLLTRCILFYCVINQKVDNIL